MPGLPELVRVTGKVVETVGKITSSSKIAFPIPLPKDAMAPPKAGKKVRTQTEDEEKQNRKRVLTLSEAIKCIDGVFNDGAMLKAMVTSLMKVLWLGTDDAKWKDAGGLLADRFVVCFRSKLLQQENLRKATKKTRYQRQPGTGDSLI